MKRAGWIKPFEIRISQVRMLGRSLGVVRGLAFAAILMTAAMAHQPGVSYLNAVVEDTKAHLSVRLLLSELNQVLKLDNDGAVSEQKLQQGAGAIRDYLSKKISLLVNDRALPVTIGDPKIWRDMEGIPFVDAELVFTSDEKIRRFAIRCDLLTEINKEHETLARITAAGKSEEFVFTGDRHYEAGDRGLASTVAQFVRLGIFHIFTGYDHIAFLLGVLLMGGSFKNIIKIVTSFTIAHSITLALAALGIVELPSRLIEPAIALSIVYIAGENLFFKSFDRRWLITFFFGLIHGFGFANVLREMDLPRSGLVASLFSFNLGVEIGQVVIVSLLLPLLWAMKKKTFYQVVIKSASVVILILGLVWLYQRIFAS